MGRFIFSSIKNKCISIDIIGKINEKTYDHKVNQTGKNDYTELLKVIKMKLNKNILSVATLCFMK